MQDVSAYLYDLFPSSCSTSMLSAHCGKKRVLLDALTL